ncbi:hypothetical protein [Halostella sp. PRR32]|uniref:hypothetical protein n=1 Tax=Halostella sp. PRR32 TaxID=3098147 RepID=UPI002B1CEACC|nr:hypothetical protein [Halostella sp. PRR32]
MSMTTDDVTDPEEIAEDNRDLFERLADSDLPIAEDFERALDALDRMEDDDD